LVRHCEKPPCDHHRLHVLFLLCFPKLVKDHLQMSLWCCAESNDESDIKGSMQRSLGETLSKTTSDGASVSFSDVSKDLWLSTQLLWQVQGIVRSVRDMQSLSRPCVETHK